MYSNPLYLFTLLLFSFAFSNNVSAQNLSLGHDGFDAIVGYQYQNYKTLELGIAYGTRGDELAALYYRNIHLCSEILFNDNGKNIYGLKTGIAYAVAFFDATGQFIYFSNFDKSSFVFRPEIGLTLAGALDLNIGQNIVVTSNDDLNLSSTVFILRLTFGQSSL